MKAFACIAALASFACGLGLSTAAGQDWPQLQHDAARTGRSSEAVVPPYRARWAWFGPDWTLRNKLTKPGDPDWTDDLAPGDGKQFRMPAKIDFSFAGSMQPIIADGRVFVGDAQAKVYAISLDDGRTLWQADNPGGTLWPGATDGKVVAFTSIYGMFTCYDAASGRQLWQIDTGKTFTCAPALADGVVYAANQGGYAYAVRLADGEQLWKTPLGAPVQGGLCVAGGKVYLGTEAMVVLALDAADGKIVALQKLPGQSFRFVWPVAVKDRVIFTAIGAICVGSEYVNDDVIGNGRQLTKWPDTPGHPNARAEEDAMLAWMAGAGKAWEETFVLRADTLQKDYIVATGGTEGCGAAPHPPAIDAQDRPLVWWATGYPTLTSIGSFGTHFSMDLSAFDLKTGRRIAIDNGRLSGQPTETDNLFGLSVGGDWVYLRQNFRGTFAINLKTSEQRAINHRIWETNNPSHPAAIYFGWSGTGSDGESLRKFLPDCPSGPHGRVAPSIAGGRLLLTENFAVLCVESAAGAR